MWKRNITGRETARGHLFIIAAFACALLLFLGTLIPLVVLRKQDKMHAARLDKEEHDVVEMWSAHFQDSLSQAIAAARTVEGYVLGVATVIPNLRDPPHIRIEGQNFTHFDMIAETTVKERPHTSLVTLSPGGVYMDSYPKVEEIYLLDMFNPLNPDVHPTPLETLNGRVTTVSGPLLSHVPMLKDLWTIIVRQPIFLPPFIDTDSSASSPPLASSGHGDSSNSIEATPSHNKGRDLQNSFWGFSSSYLNVSQVIVDADLSRRTTRENMDYMLIGEFYNRTFFIVDGSVHEDVDDFLDDATASPYFLQYSRLFVAVRSRERRTVYTASNIMIVVSVVLFVVFLFFFILSMAILLCTKKYDGRPYAPKLAPFAVLTIGPCWEEGLWDVASQELTAVSERLQRVLDKAMAAHHAYPIAQLHPYTSSYTTRSLDAAVHMAFSVLEELQRHPIDGPLRKAVGDEDGRLMVACAVHWCRNATVLLHSSNGDFSYDGPDMVAASRMWRTGISKKNTVCLSDAAKQRFAGSFLFSKLGDGSLLSSAPAPLPATPLPAASPTDTPLPPPSLAALKKGKRGSSRRKLGVSPAGSARRELDPASPMSMPLVSLCDATPLGAALGADADHRRASRAVMRNPSKHNVPATTIQTMAAAWRSRMDGSAPLPQLLTGPHAGTQQGSSSSSTRSSSNSATSGALMDPSIAAALSSTGLGTQMVTTHNGDCLSHALLAPAISARLDEVLQDAYRREAVAIDVSYNSVRVMVYYFFCSFKLLFKPLAQPERENIYRRLVIAFGVPPKNILEHLAARCTILYMQQHEESNLLLWDRQVRLTHNQGENRKR